MLLLYLLKLCTLSTCENVLILKALWWNCTKVKINSKSNFKGNSQMTNVVYSDPLLGACAPKSWLQLLFFSIFRLFLFLFVFFAPFQTKKICLDIRSLIHIKYKLLLWLCMLYFNLHEISWVGVQNGDRVSKKVKSRHICIMRLKDGFN